MKKKIILNYVLEGILTVLLVTFLSFLLMRLAPIDAAEAYVKRSTPRPTNEMIIAARQNMGLDKPLLIQYGNWLKNAVKLDFGNSLLNHQPVANDLIYAAINTLKINGISFLLQCLFVLIIAWVEFMLFEKKAKFILTAITILIISIPPFYIATIYMDVFAVKNGLLNILNTNGFFRYFSPAICIALPAAVFHGRLLGSIINKERKKDYIFFIRCRGISENRIFFSHILPNGLIVLLPIFLQNTGMIMANSGVVEMMFNVPGAGYLLINHTIERDSSMIHACLLFFALVMVFMNIVSKILRLLLSDESEGEGVII